MGKNLKNEVEYYYDSHPTVEDVMGETSFHADLVRYLMAVLTWLFRRQRCAIYENLNSIKPAIHASIQSLLILLSSKMSIPSI